MALEDQYNFEDLRNEAERLVIEELDRQLQEAPDVCRTEECILDMAAYALNIVRPMYRVTLLGRLYASAVDDAHLSEIRTAVSKAIQKVSENPA
jgi:competence protein ComFB